MRTQLNCYKVKIFRGKCDVILLFERRTRIYDGHIILPRAGAARRIKSLIRRQDKMVASQ